MADQMFSFVQVMKALTDENRVRILLALTGRELCVCQITGMLDLAPSTTSKHLSILRQARLIESRKKGKWVYYTVPNQEEASKLIQQAVAITLSSVAQSTIIQDDMRHIAEVLSLSCGCEQDTDNCHSLAIHSLESVN